MKSNSAALQSTYITRNVLINRNFQSLLVALLSLLMLAVQCECRETVLLASLSTKTDQILFKMLQETNSLFKSNRFINGKQLTCYSIGKNEYTKNYMQRPIFLNHSITYKESIEKFTSISEKTVSEQKLIKRLESILNILNGMCLYYRTNTFISQYCHKEHFRQFDDDHTKFYNQKLSYEDFYLGFYSPQSELRAKAKLSDGLTAPSMSKFTGINSTLTVSDIVQFPRNLEFQENAEGKLVHSSTHIIKAESYIYFLPIFLQIKCLSHSSGTKKQVKNTVITVTPFDFVYTKKEGKCDQFVSAMELQNKIPYEKDQKLRVFEQFLYGNVQQICSYNWKWQGPDKYYQDAQLRSGSTLFIQYSIVQGVQAVIKKQLVTVKHVHNFDLVELEQNLGISFNPKQIRKYFSKNKNYTVIQKILNCQIIFDKPVIKNKVYLNNMYLGNNLAILDKGLPISSENQRTVGCVCNLNKQGFNHLIDMNIQVGNSIFLNYYRIYLQTKTFIYMYSQFKDIVFTQCHNIDCYHYDQSYSIKQLPQGKFTKIIKVSKSNKIYNITQQNKNHIFVVSIHQRGTLRLVTKDNKGNNYFYILSEGQILKIRQFQNGTKQIIKENNYYQNMTKPSDKNIDNYIFIHAFVLSNRTKYGGLWKYRDYLYFPRFLFLDQELVSFQYRHGYTYIRKIDHGKLKNKESLAILNYQKLLEKHFKDPKSQQNQQQLFLSKSYSINYTYEGGDYCGAPINKKRTTLATLKCGKPWFKIEKVHQTSPCTYFVQIQTLLLCKQNIKQVVQSDEEIPNKTQEDKMNFSGLTCLRESGVFNKVSPFIYPGKKLLT